MDGPIVLPAASPAVRLLGSLRLMRPANALTAAADALAGVAIAWGLSPAGLTTSFWLLPLAAFFLYAGGVVLNDVCDAELDCRERPERPIPQGHVSVTAAIIQGCVLMAAGVFAAVLHGPAAGTVALGVTLLVAFYDTYGKYRLWAGPLAMGLCRAGSLLLGMAASPGGLALGWPVAAIPLSYIATITLVSRGESDGRNPIGFAALAMAVLAAGGYGYLAVLREQWPALAFVSVFAGLAWPALFHAARSPSPAAVRSAVQAGVLSLVVGDAILTAAFAGPLAGLCVLLVLPLSRGLARIFPVA